MTCAPSCPEETRTWARATRTQHERLDDDPAPECAGAAGNTRSEGGDEERGETRRADGHDLPLRRVARRRRAHGRPARVRRPALTAAGGPERRSADVAARGALGIQNEAECGAGGGAREPIGGRPRYGETARTRARGASRGPIRAAERDRERRHGDGPPGVGSPSRTTGRDQGARAGARV